MVEDEPTLLVLRQIHQEIQRTNSRLESLEKGTNSRLESLEKGTSSRLQETNDRLETIAWRQTESQMRLATELAAVAKAVGDVKDLLKERFEDHERVGDLDRRVASSK